MADYNTQFMHKLKDGTKVLFREIRPEDKERIQEGLKYLSESSVYTRFFTPVKRFSEKQLIHLTEVDQEQHVAWGVICPSHPEMPGLGTCRFVKMKENPERADFAITVIDAFQNIGLGTEFLALLYILADLHDVKYLVGSSLFSNLKLVERFKNMGAEISWEQGACDIVLPVLKDYSQFPDTDYASIFKKLLHIFKEKLQK